MPRMSIYPNGVRCMDCNRSLDDTEILRRPTYVEPWSSEIRYWELVCERCLLDRQEGEDNV